MKVSANKEKAGKIGAFIEQFKKEYELNVECKYSNFTNLKYKIINMKAEEFLKEKYKKGGCYPWSQFDLKEMVENMEEFAAQQVKLLDLHSVINWVAVSDRLPEEMKFVLCAKTHTSMDGTKRITPSVGRLNKGGRFSCEMDWVNVTHWAELPEPPCL